MINVTIFRNGKLEYVGFELTGHAEYADAGMDIVCSAVSALAITVVNSIEKLCEDGFSFEENQESGEMKLISELAETSHDMQIVLNVFVIGISDIAEAYSDYICLTFKEV